MEKFEYGLRIRQYCIDITFLKYDNLCKRKSSVLKKHMHKYLEFTTNSQMVQQKKSTIL